MVRRIDESDKNRKSVKEARIGRTKEVKVLQGNWGYGWDDLCEYDKYDNGECKDDLKAYRENDPSASYRVIFRRVPNKDYVPTESIKRNKRRMKESFNSDRYEEAQNYIDNGMTTWREIFQDCSEIARTDKELKQSMIDQCGSISKYAEEIFDAVQYILNNEASESVKRNKRVKEGFTVTDADYCRDIAEEVANIMQDMDWQDSLDDSYDSPDEAWDAYVDQVLEQLESDPQEVIDWLEDEEDYDNNRRLIQKIEKYFM